MTTITTEYHCAICGGEPWKDGLRTDLGIGGAATDLVHREVRDCVRVLASKLAQAQEDIRELQYKLNRAGVGYGSVAST